MEDFFEYIDQHPIKNDPAINQLLFDMRRAKQPNLFDRSYRNFEKFISGIYWKTYPEGWNFEIHMKTRNLYLTWLHQHQDYLDKVFGYVPEIDDIVVKPFESTWE